MKTVLDWLDATCALIPNAPAFEDDVTTLTWQRVRERSREIGTAISHSIAPQQPVAICMEKRPETVAAMLGVVQAGCFYTMVDRTMPMARAQLILQTLSPRLILCEAGDAPKWQQLMPDVPCRCVDDLGSEVDDARLAAIQRDVIDTDLMYVLFTSGSTGVPKGVSIRHRSVLDLGCWAVKALNIDSSCRFGNQAPLYFDNSVLDLVCAIRTGACVHFIPKKYFMFPGKLMDYIEQCHINTLFWVPSALMSPANAGVVRDGRPHGVRHVFFCGEVMPCKQLNVWRASLPNADYVNMYGPTEITDVCTWYRVDRTFADDDQLPIGWPCDNTRIHLIGGEICVAGTCLAAGYYHAPEKTAAAFVQNPLNDRLPERIYRTGDLGEYNDRGELMFLGRRDSQIKRQGYRMELGEIECALRACKGVSNGCCFYDVKTEQIIAVYTGQVEEKPLKAALKQVLPKYMLPDVYRALPELPQTGNGKIDRVRLKQELSL